MFGASGLVGSHLLCQAVAAGWRLHAISRDDRRAGADGAVLWHGGSHLDLDGGSGPWPGAPTVFSVGPLASFADWLLRVRPTGLRRLVALGSTSIVAKRGSPDPGERELVRRLERAEQQLRRYCADAGIAWTVLRPTLIWGDGRDRNLSRLAAQARRAGRIVLPRFAIGRRQPIHAREVAAAVLAAALAPASEGLVLDLPGGETLSYRDMAGRVAAAQMPPAGLVVLPTVLLRPALAAAHRLGLISGGTRAAVARMAQDLVFDGEPARQALGWSAAAFTPQARDFSSG